MKKIQTHSESVEQEIERLRNRLDTQLTKHEEKVRQIKSKIIWTQPEVDELVHINRMVFSFLFFMGGLMLGLFIASFFI